MVCRFLNELHTIFSVPKGEMQNLKLIDYTKKRLDDMYLIMYVIKNDIYTIVEINKKGIGQLVGIYQDRLLKNRYWLDIFESIKMKVISRIHRFYLTLSINDWFYII